jgi:hypothetical protein
MFSKKGLRHSTVALGDLSHHPAGRFVNQVVLVVEKSRGDFQSVGKFTATNEVLGCDDCDPPFSDAF